MKSNGSETESFKNALSKTFKYGSFLGLTDLIDRLWKEAQLQGIGFFKSPNAVTGYNISLNYQKISDYSITSFQFPLLTSLTTLNTQENYEQASFVYRIAYKITLFLLLIISGILFFSVEFILDFLFLEDRLIYSNYLRLIVLASIFKILAIFLQSHLNAQRKVKLSLILRIFYTSISIPLFFFGLFFFYTSISIPLFFFGLFLYGIEGAIIYGLILGNLLSMTIQIYATYRFGKVNLNIKKILSQYLTFFIPLGITIILKELLFKHITLDFTQFFGLSLLKNLDLLSTISFLLFFLAMNIILKTVTSSDYR
jgi:hypothetical protein